MKDPVFQTFSKHLRKDVLKKMLNRESERIPQKILYSLKETKQIKLITCKFSGFQKENTCYRRLQKARLIRA